MINKNQKLSKKQKPERQFEIQKTHKTNLKRTIKFLSEKTKRVPHDVNAKMSSELNEEIVHLTEVSGIPVGIKKRKPGIRVFPEGSNNSITGLSIKQMNAHIPFGRDAGEGKPPIISSKNVIGWRVRWEKGKFRSHTTGYISH